MKIVAAVLALGGATYGQEAHDDFRSFSLGNEKIPLWLLYALTKEDENGNDLSLIEWFPKYGFTENAYNREGVPTGFSFKEKQFTRFFDNSAIGISCAACHTGKFTVQAEGREDTFMVDGMPALVDSEEWFSAIIESFEALSTSRFNRLVFFSRVLAYSREWSKSSQAKERMKNKQNLYFKAYAGEGGEDNYDQLLSKKQEEDAVNLFEDLHIIEGMEQEFSELLGENTPLEERKYDVLEQSLKDSKIAAERGFYFGDQNLKSTGRRSRLKSQGRGYVRLSQKAISTVRQLLALRQYAAGPRPGLGRDAPWGIIDYVVGRHSDVTFNAPVSIPPLFGANDYKVYHVDGNTDSSKHRNILQALALSEALDPATGETTLTLDTLNKMQSAMYGIKNPQWNDYFPNVDEMLAVDKESERFRQGKDIYENRQYEVDYRVYDVNGAELEAEPRSCKDCHVTPENAEDQLFFDVGTSALRREYYNGYEERLTGLNDLLNRLENNIYSEEDAVGTGNKWHYRQGYVARPLTSIWASSPYLHNGSVPTISDLLKPASGEGLSYDQMRPQQFWVGNLVYDTEKIGYRTEEPPNGIGTLLEVDSIPGNSNKGHEFGIKLTDDEKDALLEYIKSL